MKNSVSNSYIVQANGVKVVKADVNSIVTTNKRIHVGDDTPAFAFYVCGFWDSIDQFERYGMTPHVTLYKTESEVKEYCKGKVVSYREYYANSEKEVDDLIATNRVSHENHARSLAEWF